MTEFLVTKPVKNAIAHFVMAHGAGAPMDHPFMEKIAQGLADRDVLVSRFEFPYMAMRRVDGKRRGPGGIKPLIKTWLDVVAEIGEDLPLFIGGKSMGGRVASMAAATGISGLICFGYPFHPPGKPDQLRTEHLKTMPLPTLIIQGERDPFGGPEEVAAYGLPDSIGLVWIPDGDHSLKPRKRSGRTEDGNLSLAVDAASAFIGSIVG